jgi:ER-derived vesicles protein
MISCCICTTSGTVWLAAPSPGIVIAELLTLLCIVPGGITHLFLMVNVIAMIICSTLVIIRKHSEYAVAGLCGVVITQALGYGLIFDLNFFLRNLSVLGGLMMVLSDSWVRKRFAPAGLPTMDDKDRKMYFQLGGRVLLIFLFVGFVFSGKWSFWRILVSLLGFVACVMVVVGFKAKASAVMLVVVLSIFNILVNNFWTVSWGLQIPELCDG